MFDELDSCDLFGLLHAMGHLEALMPWHAILDKRLTEIQHRVGYLRFGPLSRRASVGGTTRRIMEGHISVPERIFTD